MGLDNVKVVSFSGIDGAGKSTQIESLQCSLRELGKRHMLFTFWDNVVVFPGLREHMSLKAFKGDKGIGSPEKPITRRDKNVTSWYVVAARLFLYLLDAYSLRVAISGSYAEGADFIIFDRYIYDELANLPLHNRFVAVYVRLISMIVPKPDIAFVVDAEPEAAHSRKPEYPLEFVRRNRESYLCISRLISRITVLPPDSVEATSAKINDSVARVCLIPHTELRDLRLTCPAVHGPCESKSSNA